MRDVDALPVVAPQRPGVQRARARPGQLGAGQVALVPARVRCVAHAQALGRVAERVDVEDRVEARAGRRPEVEAHEAARGGLAGQDQPRQPAVVVADVLRAGEDVVARRQRGLGRGEGRGVRGRRDGREGEGDEQRSPHGGTAEEHGGLWGSCSGERGRRPRGERLDRRAADGVSRSPSAAHSDMCPAAAGQRRLEVEGAPHALGADGLAEDDGEAEHLLGGAQHRVVVPRGADRRARGRAG